MPTFIYENKKGERIERQYPVGKAPKRYKDYKRVFAGVPQVVFLGPGWASRPDSANL